MSLCKSEAVLPLLYVKIEHFNNFLQKKRDAMTLIVSRPSHYSSFVFISSRLNDGYAAVAGCGYG